MRRCLIVTVLVCLWTIAACGEYGWDVTPRYIQGTPYDFSDDEREAILGEHNDIRASLRARNMLRLEWDEDLAAIASNYAQECTFNYNPHRHDLSTFSYVGENIAAIDSTGVHDPGPVYKVSGSGEARINIEYFVESVRKWFRDDAPFYSHDYHYCNPLARCHCRFYLQMVWAETCSIGCGVAFCPFVRYYSAPDVYLLICNYGPGRNLIKDVHDPPYEAGRHGCDDCPDGYECSDSGLCVSDSNKTVCGMYRARDDGDSSSSDSSSSSSSSSESTDTTATDTTRSDSSNRTRSRNGGRSDQDRSSDSSESTDTTATDTTRSDSSNRTRSRNGGRSDQDRSSDVSESTDTTATDTTRSDSSNQTRSRNGDRSDQDRPGRSRSDRDGSRSDKDGSEGSESNRDGPGPKDGPGPSRRTLDGPGPKDGPGASRSTQDGPGRSESPRDESNRSGCRDGSDESNSNRSESEDERGHGSGRSGESSSSSSESGHKNR